MQKPRSAHAVALVRLGSLLLIALSIGCAAVAKVEEPSFTVESKDGPFEIRQYAPRVIAETEVTGDRDGASTEGFRRLAGYIFGGNTINTKIAMTAPVGQTSAARKIAMTAPVGQRAQSNAAWLVSFTMPAGETLASLPTPNDARVVLRELAPVKVAVMRFSGRWKEDTIATNAASLRAWLGARGMRATGEVELNRYDPPWTPWFMRRNELWLTLAPSTAANATLP